MNVPESFKQRIRFFNLYKLTSCTVGPDVGSVLRLYKKFHQMVVCSCSQDYFNGSLYLQAEQYGKERSPEEWLEMYILIFVQVLFSFIVGHHI
jgi:hypothetical protein